MINITAVYNAEPAFYIHLHLITAD